MKIFPEIDYFALKQMAQRNHPNVDESDDERNCVNEEIKEDDEFTTYFSENRVDIPEDDKVIGISVMCHQTHTSKLIESYD
jgi:hypothetical protein